MSSPNTFHDTPRRLRTDQTGALSSRGSLLVPFKVIRMDWWVTKGDRKPIGPVSTELLLEGIAAGKIPRDALVCEVGGTTWRCIGEIPPFSVALEARLARRRSESSDELPETQTAANENYVYGFDDAPEHTTVDRAPLRPSEPPARMWIERFDDVEEQTVVDAPPFRKSEPPTEP